MQVAESSPKWVENTVEKEEIACYKQTRNNQGLFGKGLRKERLYKKRAKMVLDSSTEFLRGQKRFFFCGFRRIFSCTYILVHTAHIHQRHVS